MPTPAWFSSVPNRIARIVKVDGAADGDRLHWGVFITPIRRLLMHYMVNSLSAVCGLLRTVVIVTAL